MDTELDRRAAALADIQQMHEDLRRALDMLGQYKADIARLQDQLQLITADRDRMRADMHIFRDKCVELATSVSNIGLITVTAQNIVMTVRELTEAGGRSALEQQPPAPPAPAPPSPIEILSRIGKGEL